MNKLAAMMTFRRVAELGGFAAAARDLDLSNAAVSKHVRELELELGAVLFARTTRRLSLTEAGAELYRRSVRALEEIQNAELEVARFQTEPRGALRISAPMSFSILHLGPVVHGFLERYPGVSIELDLNDAQVDLVKDGVDLAIRIGRLQDSSLIARKIAPCRQVLCAAPAYLEKRGLPERPEDLLEHNCIVYTLLSAPREWRFMSPEGEPLVVPVNGSMHSNNGLVNRAAAIAGAGIVLLPTFYVGEELRAGTLKPILCKFKPQEIAIHAVYPERRNLMPKVRAFVDHLAATFGPEPPWEKGWSLED